MTLSEIRATLREYSLRPLPRFGQNFLHDANLCRWIAQEILASLNEPYVQPILEIGPGLGSLTHHLLDCGLRIHAVEIDRGLYQYLTRRFDQHPHFQITLADILKFLPTALEATRWPAIVGNLPYNISTPILFSILKAHKLPDVLFFMLQDELADRLRASPGTKNYGAPSVILQQAYTITHLKTIPPQLFYPAPEVHSALLRFKRKWEHVSSLEFLKFQRAVRTAFQQRRKQLRATLPCDSTARPEELSPDEWWTLSVSLPDDFYQD
jgi:16S rRNA (adenine1518-N6/adenine1519-N6)-dimethyltransferase